jgi:hypothetical protein
LEDSDKLMHEVILRAQGKLYTLPDDKDASVEYGLILYWIQHPPELLTEILHKIGVPDWLWDAITYVAPKPAVTTGQYDFITRQVEDGKVIIAPDGSVIGEGTYELLDKKWLYAFGNYLLNLAYPSDIAPFGTSPFSGTMSAGKDGKVRIMVIGDWGTGNFDEGGGYNPAKEILDRVNTLQPDYLFHLGDVYYSGTQDRLPPGEEQSNFLDLWPKLPAERCFTLNSNHEMYGGANGYFNVALGRDTRTGTPFNHQKGTSYFSLKFGDWIIVGLDAAYHDPSSLYMQGSLGDPAKFPHQYAFLKETVAGAKKVMLLSHQTAMSTDGKTALQLWLDVKDIVSPDYWYWGHIHLGIVYSDSSCLGGENVKARCVGHSAVPFGDAWGLEDDDCVSWYANTPIGTPETENLNRNGFALLTLGSDGSIEEAFYETGNSDPVIRI